MDQLHAGPWIRKDHLEVRLRNALEILEIDLSGSSRHLALLIREVFRVTELHQQNDSIVNGKGDRPCHEGDGGLDLLRGGGFALEVELVEREVVEGHVEADGEQALSGERDL